MILSWALQNTIIGAAMAGLIAAACRLWRVSPALRHALWLLVLLKLLTPPVVAWPWRLPGGAAFLGYSALDREEPTPRELDREATETVEESFPLLDEAEDETVLALPAPVEDATDSLPGRQNDRQAPASAPAASDLLPWLWLGGMLLAGSLEAIRIVRMSRSLRRARPATGEVAALVTELARRLEVSPPPALLLEGASSPFVWCLGRPKLVLPASLAAGLSADALRSVVAHELAHLKRRDHWVGWLDLAAEITWWWNPLYWLVRREVRESAELACDAWVVWSLPASRRTYAETLIEVCQRLSENEAPAPALGMGGGRRQAFFRRRLTMILIDSVPRRLPCARLVMVGLVGLAFLPGWTQEADEALPVRTAATPAPAADEAAPAKPAQPRQPAQPPQPAPAVQTVPPVPPSPVALPPRAVRAGTPPHAEAVPSPRDAPYVAPGTSSADYGEETEGTRTYRHLGRASAGLAAVAAESADRLEVLERTLAQLAKDVAELRAQSSSFGGANAAYGAAAEQYREVVKAAPRRTSRATATVKAPRTIEVQPPHATAAVRRKQESNRYAQIFDLPGAKAEALAEFLKEHLGRELEVSVKGDQLILESDGETNTAVRLLVSLMTAKD